MDPLKNIAVLFDADNTDYDLADEVLSWASLQGNVSVKRAYGNFQKEDLKGWKEACLENAICPVQQFDYVKGKNATDMALVIDAIELKHTGLYDGFVIVSSDSDFTPLLIKIKESGIKSFGVGKKDSPRSFINACNLFCALEDLEKPKSKDKPKKNRKASATTTDQAHNDKENDLFHLMKKAYEQYQNDDGYALLTRAAEFVQRAIPDFSIKDFGAKNWLKYLEARPDRYEVKSKSVKGQGSKVVRFKTISE